jgi:NAD(P)H dehydrogenase (quinone)
MIKPRIIVTGATGKTGSVVVSELLKAGYPVRAMVHREDGRSARLKAQGAEMAVADMSDVERVAEALKNVQRAYYCPPYDPYAVQGAVASRLPRKNPGSNTSVGLTQWLAGPAHPSLTTRQSWLVDRLFSMIPGPSAPQLALESKVWQREHVREEPSALMAEARKMLG